jgi:predicted metal-dependent enzyme (double-stranded beta helix superfamily)
VHGHHAWCGYAVLGGCLHETLYRYDGKAGLALPESGAAVGPGTTRFAHAGIGAVHKLGNAGDNDAWSLHIYGVAGANLAAGINLVVPAAATTSLQQKIPTSLAEQVQ